MALSEAPAKFIQFYLTDPSSVEHMNNSATNYGFTIDIQSGKTDQGTDKKAELPIVTVSPNNAASSFAQFFHGIVLSQEYTQLFDLTEKTEVAIQSLPKHFTTEELPKSDTIFQKRRPVGTRLRPAA